MDSIPISESQKIFISNGIYRAITLDMPEVIEENHLPTYLGSGLFRWNFIIRNLSDAFAANFEAITAPRGAWKVLLLHDLESNLSFSIMSERNFQKLRNSRSDRVHYLEALISKNEKREPIERQICMDGFQKVRDESLLSIVRDQLLNSFSGIVKEHVLVLFDCDFSGVTSLRAVLLTPELEIAVSDDWTKYLKSTFVPDSSALAFLLDDDDEPIVKLKTEYEPDNSIVDESREAGSEDKHG